MSDHLKHVLQEGSHYRIGRHIILDIWTKENLNDHKKIEEIFKKAINKIGATILDSSIVEFQGGGSTGMFILSESHASWHTYSEVNYIAIDVFTCGKCDPTDGLDIFIDEFKPYHHSINTINRGKIKKDKICLEQN